MSGLIRPSNPSPRSGHSSGDPLARPQGTRQQSAYRIETRNRRQSEADVGYSSRGYTYSRHSMSVCDTGMNRFSPETDLAWNDGEFHYMSPRRIKEEQEIHEDIKRALLYQRRARDRKAANAKRASADPNVPHLTHHRDSLSSDGSYDELRTPKSTISYGSPPTHSLQLQNHGKHNDVAFVHDTLTPRPVIRPSQILGIPISSSPGEIDEPLGSSPPRKGSVSFILGEVSKRLIDSTRSRRRKGSVSGSRSRSSSVLHSLMRTSPATQGGSPTLPHFPALQIIPSQQPLSVRPETVNHRYLRPLPRFNPFMRTRAESLSSLDDTEHKADGTRRPNPAFINRRIQSTPPPQHSPLF